jgi:phosphoribosylformylglycinamidine synthase subunit PurQ / glutaminase
MNKVNAIVLRAAGTNCDRETCHALKLAGADSVDLVHVNELIRGEKKLGRYHIMAFPGGFSYGDDVSAGKIFAVQLKHKIWDDVKRFDDEGKLIIGICNGFQVLVKLGLLPGVSASGEPVYEQTATLGWNNSGRFECRWVYLKPAGKNCLWTAGLPRVIQLPIAHAEGKFMTGGRKLLERLEKNSQVAFRYVDGKGKEIAAYPYNPNGSVGNIAGITNPKGNVFGLMPHPERFISKYQHPAWTRAETAGMFKKEEGAGLRIFRNAVNYARKNLCV